MIRKREAATPPETVVRLLVAAGAELVLVGGQSLAFWADRYGILRIGSDVPAVSNDVDLLAGSAADTQSVRRLAEVIGGEAVFPNRRSLTSLVGQAIRHVSEEEYLNVDVIFKVVGIEADAVWKRAVHARIVPGAVTLVMHPLDVLASRLANLYKLPDKQNDKGRMQLALAIDVARAFLRREAAHAPAGQRTSGRSPLQDYVSQIEKLAMDDAGRKVAARDHLYVADAIDPHLIPPGPFWTKRWPHLRGLMSDSYRATIKEP